MTSLEYEDSLGGLMPQILALTAPPGARENNKQTFQPQHQPAHCASSSQLTSNGNDQIKPSEAGLAAHPYFRRPGRGHNRDCCDACSEGGDLICCDLCPASFHLTCHDPPLDEDEIPTGEWACHQCRMGNLFSTQKKEEDKTPCCSGGKSGKASKPSRKKDKDKDEKHKVFAGGREICISDTPLTTLIKAAAIINPTQFTLPYELTLPANFPGEPKEAFIRRNGARRGPPKKKPYELDNGLVPLPAKLCFQCNKSCRVGPLIPCDFCPLFYHLDCLDPPLATPPMGRWMCPNHPEHHMDTSLLTSHSLTERVKLWDKFSVPVDQDAVKLNFLQRCHRLNPPFRYKLKKVLRSRLRVPGSIKAHYQDPPDLLPHLSPSHYIPFPPPIDLYPHSAPPPPVTKAKTLPPSASTYCQSKPYGDIVPPQSPSDVMEEHHPNLVEIISVEAEKREADEQMRTKFGVDDLFICAKPTQQEQDEWLASLLYLQSSTLKLLMKDSQPPKSPLERRKEPCNGLPQSPPESSPDLKPNFLNGDLVSHDAKTHKMSIDALSNHISHSGKFSFPETSRFFSTAKIGRKTHKRKLSSTSGKCNRSKKNTPVEILSDTLSNLHMLLQEKIDENNAEINVSGLEQSVVEVLAYQRLKQILDPPGSIVEFTTPRLLARALLCPLVPDIRLKDLAPKGNSYSTDPVPMIYRILNIGKGSHNHVNLEMFGHCNYISNQHACILFDETTGYYELLNYSEFSTVVDGVMYHGDFSDKTVSHAVPPPFMQQVKAMIAKRRGVQALKVCSPPLAMSSRSGEDFVRCRCKRKEMDDSSKSFKEFGWEGTAVLHHGSFIRFGCLKFVFSVVEEASNGDWPADALITYEKFIKAADEEREKESNNERETTNEKEKKIEDKYLSKS